MSQSQMTEDSDRLEWLERMVRQEGALHLHDGDHPNGLGLGLKGRSLREAIDVANCGAVK